MDINHQGFKSSIKSSIKGFNHTEEREGHDENNDENLPILRCLWHQINMADGIKRMGQPIVQCIIVKFDLAVKKMQSP